MATTIEMRQGLTGDETKLFDRLGEITPGYTTTVRGVVVTRWSADMFELGSHGRYTERRDEAAINLARMSAAA